VTLEIGLVLAILVASLALFLTERVRMDVVAMLVLAVLAVTGLVTPTEALSGFSNPAVITVWAMFILSAGLAKTGVAATIGRSILGWVGRSEPRMIAVIMLTAGGLSAVMNNIGVAALMLPVVLNIARRTGRPPSRLLMPLAYGTLLGGLTTLIGTPPNILVSESMRQAGLTPFGMFDFTPVGLTILLVGTAFVALVGRHLLPAHDPGQETVGQRGPNLQRQYALDERSVVMRLPEGSALEGRTLQESRFGSATGLNVYAIMRDGTPRLAPGPDVVLHSGDRLLVDGTLDRLDELRGWHELVIGDEDLALQDLVSSEIALAQLTLPGDSELVGQTLAQIGFRRRYAAVVLVLVRDEKVIHHNLEQVVLRGSDRLLVQGRREPLDELRRSSEFDSVEFPSAEVVQRDYALRHSFFSVHVPAGSRLVGRSLAENRLGGGLGLAVLGVTRTGSMRLLPDPDEPLQADDRLLVRGRTDALKVFRGLQGLEIEGDAAPRLKTLESERTGLVEVTLSPRTRLLGKTLRELAFRERYGFLVLAILHRGQTFHAELGDRPLGFGDALLLLGPRQKLELMEKDPDFLVLTQLDTHVPDTRKAPAATIIMAGVLVPVLAGWLPISISAVVGATLMVLTGCLAMDEAYRAIEWKSVFLIAGMLPLGTAMQQTGVTSLVAESVLSASGSIGPWGVVLSLYLVTAAATAIVPTAALVVLMAPIAHTVSVEMGLSPQATLMAVAIAASASFTSPVSHPANVLVMGPGGYRFVDYVKLGVPLTIVVLLVTALMLPIVWPLFP
jgi:di/tricarboxylate transporter